MNRRILLSSLLPRRPSNPQRLLPHNHSIRSPPLKQFFSTSKHTFVSSESQALQRAIRQIQEKFIEAKDEYEVALESQGTTYAVEDNETARQIASELSEVYDGVMKGGELSDDEKQTVKEKLSARIRELTNGVENNLHDSD